MTAPAASSESPFAPRALLRLAAVAFAFGLLVLVVRAFQLESKAFLRVLVLSFAGFLVHHGLPTRFRMPFFALLSLAACVVVLGVKDAAVLFALGSALIGLAHLPVAFPIRLALIALVGAGLAATRAGWVDAPGLAAIWPVLGSMFMFRLAIYLYDLRHRAAPFDVWRSLSYFFMLPNVCFPLFPVVDYKTFVRSHFHGDPFQIYGKGLRWMLRGVVHLLLYRLVYQNLLIGADAVSNATEAAQAIATTFLLYLRVSGEFHLVVGLLHLFGFDLPEAFQRWLVASSFTDFWRRINIYWKDFMQKLFFNPAYLGNRRRLGETGALVAATVWTFFVTWALHSYQWFWIRGVFPVRAPDVIFWALLGGLFLANILRESRRGRVRSLGARRRSLRGDVMLGLRSTAMFVFIGAAWSLWTSPSLTDWWVVASHLLRPTAAEAAVIVASLVAFGAAAVAVDRWASRPAAPRGAATGGVPRTELAVAAASAALLLLASAPARLGFAPALADITHRLRAPGELSRGDTKLLERGYYEDLTDVVRFNPRLAELYAEMPPDWSAAPQIEETPDAYPPYRLHASADVTFRGARLTTNRWAMRDRDYAKEKPPGVFRIALLGDSHSLGSGVGDPETYENLLEDRLNREAGNGERYEILNFSVGGYGPLSRLAVLEQKVFDFAPDWILYVGIDDFTWIVNELANAAENGFRIPFPRAEAVLRESGIDGKLPRVVAERRLAPHAEELLAWVYAELAAQAKAHGARPVAVFIPKPEATPGEREVIAAQGALAEGAGFDVIDVSGAYAGAPSLEELWVARWDHHPNAAGHRLLAEAFYEALSAGRLPGARRAP